MSRKKNSEEGYIVEFFALGKSVKVTAFDPATLKEVSVVAPVKTPKSDLIRLAVRKLEYVLEKSKKT